MTRSELQRILARFPKLSVAVVGDFCVDRYFDVDSRLEPDISKETGLPINQVLRVRAYPGGSGTVVNNLHALGVGEILPVGFVGRDGEGFELREALSAMNVRFDYFEESARRTPVYTKALRAGRGAPREFSRFDIFPQARLTLAEERSLCGRLDRAFERADALIVSDYTEAGKPGAVTPRVRAHLFKLAARNPEKAVLADSRLFVDKFAGLRIKANELEVRRLLGLKGSAKLARRELADAACSLARRRGREIYVTLGARGMIVCAAERATHWNAFPASGPIDIVGAGDSVTASVTSALAAGASPQDAGLLGVLVSSITIQQIGVTGVARPGEIRERFKAYARKFPEVVKS